MDDEKSEYDGSVLGRTRSNRVKRFVVVHPEAGFATMRELIRAAVDEKLQALGAE